MRSRIVIAVAGAALALFVALPIGIGIRGARANSVMTSSFGCAWTADTYFSAPTISWGVTAGDSICTTDAALDFSWYDTSSSSWVYTGWQHTNVYFIQRGGAPASTVYASHWIYVPGGGWGQRVDTAE